MHRLEGISGRQEAEQGSEQLEFVNLSYEVDVGKGIIRDGIYVSKGSTDRGSGISYFPASSSGTESRRSFSLPLGVFITRFTIAFCISGFTDAPRASGV